ncbi:MAG: hypothetical protein HOP12_00975 [Candidatus Eisenbacteria bacterium]|uniref:FlgD/Vpr Ig-like domain-containing protein n=1 Tax=Eiseniibacteriota bacterium TaxID=2212470 RepID=A0A849SMR0_UNCEI|nr:hypothetical protein [Candidatus Eisenbacteria bacterium]
MLSSVRSLLAPSRLALAALAVAFAATLTAPARADDAAADFIANVNLVGNRWCYGSTVELGGTFTLLAAFTDGFGRPGFRSAVNGDQVMKNATASDLNLGGGVIVPALAITLEPKLNNKFTVIRWKAPAAGAATVIARFSRCSPNSFQATQVAVLHNNARMFSRWMVKDVSGSVTTSVTLTVAAGDLVDFVAGTGDGNATGDVIALDVTVNMEPTVNPAGPVISFAGQRFVACAGDSANESVAFDPINRRLASNGIIRSLCGSALSNGPDGAPGLAWDPRTNTYWQITNARVVKQWSAAGAFMGNLFTIPLTFSVPGWGVDTLEAPKGIAVDSNFVYVVDAGDVGVQGQIKANEWFKFSRTGTPVKSSKLTNFHANLDLSPDAIVDDVLYMPFTAPFLKGKLIIPLEHSGMQVIDTEGNFVAKFRWTDANVPAGLKLFAFTGITIDPLTGNLYLVENDGGGTTQIWTRIPAAGASYYAVGTGFNVPRLQLPAVGCNRPLWKGMPSDASLVFGCSYRSVNQTVYGMDFGSSEIFRFTPSTGAGSRALRSGVENSWAFAYDTDRDVFYGATEFSGGPRLIAIDPVTGVSDPRPGVIGFGLQDIAFNSLDKKVYGVSGAQLIRIDRDTGVGQVVGPTQGVSGLDFDAVSARLIGIQNSAPGGGANLWSIDPSTGSSSLIANVPTNSGWEGLAVVPVAAAGVVAVSDAPSAESSQFLTAWPNPSREAVTLRFSLPIDAQVTASVFDVQGRLVRSLDSRRLQAGPHRLEWDGRGEDGKRVAAGVYFARAEFGSNALITRVVRID